MANLFDVLNMTISEAVISLKKLTMFWKIKVLDDVGLGYVQIGQSSTTLSGGEAQNKTSCRIRKKQTGNTFYT